MTADATGTNAAKHRLIYVEQPHGRQWAECACGWASPDILGRAEMRRQWWKHIRTLAAR